MCGSIIAAIPSNGTACNGLGAGLQLYPRLCVRPFFPWCMKVHPCMCIVVRIVVHEESDIALPT